MLEKNRAIADSIVGVSKVENAHPVFDARINAKGLISPYQGEKFKFYRRQDIEDLYYFEGSLYLSDTDNKDILLKIYEIGLTTGHELTILNMFQGMLIENETPLVLELVCPEL